MNQVNNRDWQISYRTAADLELIGYLASKSANKHRRDPISDRVRWLNKYLDNPEKAHFVGVGVTLLEERGVPEDIYKRMETELITILEKAFDEISSEKTIHHVKDLANTAIKDLFSKHMRFYSVQVDTIEQKPHFGSAE